MKIKMETTKITHYNKNMSALDQVLQKLGIEKSKSLVKVSDSGWRDLVPYRLQKGLEEINPSRIYLQKEKPLILFFDSSDIDEKEVSKKIWNLGGAPIIFFIKNETVSIYNGFLFDTEKSVFNFLEKDSKNVQPDNVNLSFWDITSGKLWHKLSKEKGASRVDEKLLENIQAAQEVLVEKNLNPKIANNLIGRLLFARYLLDRGVKIDDQFFKDKTSFLALIKNKDNLYSFFEYIKQNFNGDLFPLEKDESKSITDQHLEVLHNLFSGTEIATGQLSLFEHYDFNIIPVELISEVYERFMGAENQRKEGAYYTPAFLVDYILQKTVKEKLKKDDTCKVLDPSCGSGIFLVETLRCIIEKRRGNKNLTKNELKSAVKENIFGVDKDENAVNLTIFSLYLTLLDYQNPRDISQFKFPNLKNENIFVSDFFDLENGFNQKLKNVELDFILGNPPWKSDKDGQSHIDYYTKENIPVSDKQLAQTFTARVKDFSSKGTSCALVITSKILYNHNANDFRKYLLENFLVNEVLELSPVRKHLFKRATAPSAVLFYKYAHDKKTNKNTVIHTSIKPNIFLKYLGLITIEKNDTKRIQQEYFQEYDWLWKVLLYGNVFDFYFLKRLKKDYKTLNEIIDENKLLVGQGVQIGGGDKNDATHLIGKRFLDTNPPKRPIKQFLIDDNNLNKWERKTLHRPRNKNLFKAPYVLVKKGFTPSDFSVVSAYSEKDFIFTDSITAIKGGKKNSEMLKNISGILNSDFLKYYLLLQGSSAGIEREQGHNKDDRFTVPVAFDEKLSGIIDSIHKLKQEIFNLNFYDSGKEIDLSRLKNNLNEEVFKVLNTSKTEKMLIDYALEISIPLFNSKNDPIKSCKEDQLKKYAQVFINHFGKKWNGNNNKFFEVDIYSNDFIAGINFKVTNKKGERNINFKKDKNTLQSLSQALNIGLEKITDKFLTQRDIRGFQTDSFFIVKPNEYKNWHPALAQVDLHEFLQDMMEADIKDNKK